jgi:hypothetical protein
LVWKQVQRLRTVENEAVRGLEGKKPERERRPERQLQIVAEVSLGDDILEYSQVLQQQRFFHLYA